jgi:hypothetical protein
MLTTEEQLTPEIASRQLPDLLLLEDALTRSLHKVPIGSIEGRNLFGRRVKVREALAATQRATTERAEREAFLDLP